MVTNKRENDTGLNDGAAAIDETAIPVVGTVLWQVMNNGKLLRCTVEHITCYNSAYRGIVRGLVLSRRNSEQGHIERTKVDLRAMTHDLVAPGVFWTRADAIEFVIARFEAQGKRAKAAAKNALKRYNAAIDDIAAWESRDVTSEVSK